MGKEKDRERGKKVWGWGARGLVGRQHPGAGPQPTLGLSPPRLHPGEPQAWSPQEGAVSRELGQGKQDGEMCWRLWLGTYCVPCALPSCLLNLPNSPVRLPRAESCVPWGSVPVPTPGPREWHLLGKWVLREASVYDGVTLYSSGVSMGGLRGRPTRERRPCDDRGPGTLRVARRSARRPDTCRPFPRASQGLRPPVPEP